MVELQLLGALLTENEAAACNGEGHDDGRDDGEFEGLRAVDKPLMRPLARAAK
ncbi:MAG: hypothetical protein SPK00_01490 [Corynebacterium glucuronolyticum]|nr:hypothetical protein [Mycobacteriaceae bacterium]MDY5833415.1 hypothetical protein [Corynebacterium glucuronolyticum]